MSRIFYAIEIVLSADQTPADYAAIGLKDSAFRFITDRPGYTGNPSTGTIPTWGVAENLSAHNPCIPTPVAGQWYEGFLTKEAITGNPSRAIDISMGGNYGNQGGFSFSIRSDVYLISYCQTNNIYLISQRVNFYVVIDDVFYQAWSGVITNNPEDELTVSFVCQDDSLIVHKNIPPNIITAAAYSNSTNQGDAVPVCMGDVPYAKLKNLVNLQKDTNGNFTNSVNLNDWGGVLYKQTSVSHYDDGVTSGTIAGRAFTTLGRIALGIITQYMSIAAGELTGCYLIEIGADYMCKVIGNDASAGGYTIVYLNGKLPYDWATFNAVDGSYPAPAVTGTTGNIYVTNSSTSALIGPQQNTKWFEIFKPTIKYKFSQVEDINDVAGAAIAIDASGYPEIETYKNTSVNGALVPNVTPNMYSNVGQVVDLSATTDDFTFLTNNVNESGKVNLFKIVGSNIPRWDYKASTGAMGATLYYSQNLEAVDGYRCYNSNTSITMANGYTGPLTLYIQPGVYITIGNRCILRHGALNDIETDITSYNVTTGKLDVTVLVADFVTSPITFDSWTVCIGDFIPGTIGNPYYLAFDINDISDITLEKYYALIDLNVYATGTVKISVAFQQKDIFGELYSAISSFVQIASKTGSGYNFDVNCIPNYYYDLIKGNYAGDTDAAYFSDVMAIDIAAALKNCNSVRVWFKVEGCNSSLVKEIVFFGTNSFDTIQGTLYAKVSGEKCGYYPDGTVNPNSSVINPGTGLPTLTPTNDVYHAFMHMLEDYDRLKDPGGPGVEYDNISTTRAALAGWYCGRQLTDQQNSVQYLIELCKQSFVGMFSNRLGKKQLTSWLDKSTLEFAFTQNNIVADSIQNWQLSDVTSLFNELTVNYAWDPGANAFDKAFIVANVDQAAFPASGTLISGTTVPLWTTYCSGPSYDDAKDAWEACRTAYLKNHTVQMADTSLTDCYWYQDGNIYSYLAQETAWTLFLLLINWTTQQKETVDFNVPISAANMVFDLLSFGSFADTHFTLGQTVLGWLYKIEIDARNDQILFSFIGNPGNMLNQNVVVERGVILNEGNTITERGITLNAGNVVTEGA